MAESKFTSGPLVAEPHRDCGIFRIKAGEENIASIAFWMTDELTAKANAELWADAPRMLKALRALCTHAGIPQDGDEDVAQAAFDEAVAILEKHGG